jgi:poly(ribitol-phosphate) beta-N-acetylglucosaminyltransferase
VSAGSAPDVSVVIAVYNTMPYLTECLGSVLGQSIGVDRLEVVAVDDGSTDDSGPELDRWAQRHPGTVKVIHQANSGGPASPSNRALDVVTGRYVFFLGADDHLGAEALERLVATADELDADIVLGRLVGANGRVVNQQVYRQGNADDITLVNSALPWALSNTKLFRRSLIEGLGLRYPEEMRSGSDQPFTMRAVVAARRIAVRADYAFYYAVRRNDSSNITYGTPVEGFLRDAAVLMDTAADVITDPLARERVLHRHFSWEVTKLLGERFLAAAPEEQRRVQEGVRKLADAYLTEAIRANLEVQRRIPVSIAQHGTVDDIIAVARHLVVHGLSPVVVEDDAYYVAAPGFRDPARRFPDSWFDGSTTIRKLAHQVRPADVRWERGSDGGRTLVVGWRSPLPGLAEVEVLAGDRPATVTTVPSADGGTEVRAEFAVGDLVGNEHRRKRRRVEFAWTTNGQHYSDWVTGLDLAGASRVIYRRGLRFYVVHTDCDGKLRLSVVINPVTPRRIAGLLARKLRLRRAP